MCTDLGFRECDHHMLHAHMNWHKKKKFRHHTRWIRIAKTNSENKLELSDIKEYFKVMNGTNGKVDRSEWTNKSSVKHTSTNKNLVDYKTSIKNQ